MWGLAVKPPQRTSRSRLSQLQQQADFVRFRLESVSASRWNAQPQLRNRTPEVSTPIRGRWATRAEESQMVMRALVGVRMTIET